MMIAESSVYPSMDERKSTTMTTEISTAVKIPKLILSPLPSSSSSSSSMSSSLSLSATLTTAAATTTIVPGQESALSRVSHQSSQTQSEKNQQSQQQQQQSPPDRSILSTTNVFTNFPPSCCCRQMMTMMTTTKTETSASVISNNNTNNSNNDGGNSCKKSSKNCAGGDNGDGNGNNGDSQSSFTGTPSPFRQLLPIALCILSFATVLSILIVYMDTTEIRHQQFRLNMSRDYELYGVQQDDPTLIAFLREIHMKKYPMNFLKDGNTPSEHLNFSEHHELTPEMANYISNLVGDKLNGAFIQSMTGTTSYAMTAPWLTETLNWSGLIIEPEPRRYFSLRKQNAHRPKIQIVHACLSPSGYPKEVRLHNEDDSEVRINSLLDEENSWFNPRVKCFPLYTLMLAINKVDYDLLSLGCPDHELQILQTLPFNKVNIEVISIHLTDNYEKNVNEYIRNVTKFLQGKSYKFQKKFENNYIYQRINNNRTKKQNNRKSMLMGVPVTTKITTTTTTTTTTATATTTKKQTPSTTTSKSALTTAAITTTTATTTTINNNSSS